MSSIQNNHPLNLEALQSGDRAEFAKLVSRYSGQIYRLALKMLKNQQDAEDILQETFIKAFKALPDFEGRSKLSTWLYRIATNEALMFLRRKRPDTVSVEQPREDDDDQPSLQIIDWCCLPEGEFMSSEALGYLQESVDKLPESLRVVFLLRDIEGLSTRETANVLDLTETAVKTRLSRARLRLREMLTTYFGQRLPSNDDLRGA